MVRLVPLTFSTKKGDEVTYFEFDHEQLKWLSLIIRIMLLKFPLYYGYRHFVLVYIKKYQLSKAETKYLWEFDI
jgi:hypothetical protein